MTQETAPKLLHGDIIENQAARYEAARRVMQDEGIIVKHIRPHIVGDFGGVALHNGGITVAFRQLPTDSFVEISTAMCSQKEIYNRKVGTALAVEQFANHRRIRVPALGLPPAQVVESLFRGHLTFTDQD
ncbi:hypothetical protein WJ96_04220 [Burkholderia ubonensis]|uniref:Uncharacterized protein n=1 Tax=Burkholderia ubonensis TaxID=101571 RepID=A0AAW3N1A5_9BURK|nr:hypothetical protein [Burkholderia ubonensis]KVP65580.1 hypothetical protein WJ93_23965 [Burkholderia ubonensis]KVP96436.1 hypothetical protein WJ97_11135 [Burkholderia ubonensis]KVP97781.1 hypothetical protein WJ96_04220 [Burkholderia ubonensis]KVZ92478.1 hypothetical protein WL25_15875 [Burkholderia ubonensis]